MTQMLHLSRPLPRSWFALAHVLAGAPASRRPEFALTEPSYFRSECFAEDLPAAPIPILRAELLPQRSTAWFVALLVAAPTATALLGAAVMMLERAA
jgi:hypothetical protein